MCGCSRGPQSKCSTCTDPKEASPARAASRALPLMRARFLRIRVPLPHVGDAVHHTVDMGCSGLVALAIAPGTSPHSNDQSCQLGSRCHDNLSGRLVKLVRDSPFRAGIRTHELARGVLGVHPHRGSRAIAMRVNPHRARDEPGWIRRRRRRHAASSTVARSTSDVIAPRRASSGARR
jgi:hypothetical protein